MYSILSHGWNQFSGARFVVDYVYNLVQKNSALLTKIVFEQAEDILIDGKNIGRIYDIAIDGIKYELKNWSRFFPSTIRTQFIRDLSNIDNLAQLKWVFNKTDGMPDIGTLKKKVIDVLESASGKEALKQVPLEKIADFTKLKNLNEATKVQAFISHMKDINNFKKVFNVVE